MIFTQALLILFGMKLSFAIEPQANVEWINSLHIKNGVREVVSSEWYLSKERTLNSEYSEFFKELRSENGQQIACEFPTRFKIIQKSESVPNEISLDKCNELIQFKNFMRKKHLSLSLTSEHLNAPASAFGHNMLIFHDEKNIEMDANVVHFSAMTNNESPFRYIANGLTGIFSGYFFYEPFFKKFNEYSDIEQRYIYTHELKITSEQLELLLDHLYELKKARFKYYFATKNCGYQLNGLLDLIYNKQSPNPILYFLPIESLFNHKTAFQKKVILFPLARKANKAIAGLETNEKVVFNDYISGQSDNKPTNPDTNKALYLYNKFLFRSKRKISPNYEEISQTQFINQIEENYSDTSVTPIEIAPPKKIYIESEFNNKNAFYNIGFRPVMMDMYDFQNYKENEANFNILKTEISLKDEQLELKNLDLLDLKLLNPSRPFFRDPSWNFNLSLNRNNNEEVLSPSISAGIGQTYEWIINTAFLAGGGFDLEDFHSGKFQLIGTLNNYFYIGDQIKFFQETKIRMYDERKPFITNEFTLIKRISDFDIYGGYFKKNDDRIKLGFDYHF